jgi:hypothetical protein
MPYTCIAYQADGTLCRAPASILDRQRGGMVCDAHGLLAPAPTQPACPGPDDAG